MSVWLYWCEVKSNQPRNWLEDIMYFWMGTRSYLIWGDLADSEALVAFFSRNLSEGRRFFKNNFCHEKMNSCQSYMTIYTYIHIWCSKNIMLPDTELYIFKKNRFSFTTRLWIYSAGYYYFYPFWWNPKWLNIKKILSILCWSPFCSNLRVESFADMGGLVLPVRSLSSTLPPQSGAE